MQKQLHLQKTMMTLYIIIAVVAFSYSLCFMTAYKDLFGLMLKQNSNIAYFHDVFMQNFNQQIFWFTLYGVVLIALFYIFGVNKYIPDLIATVVLTSVLVVVCIFCVYSIIELPSLQKTYLSLDFSGLSLEGAIDYQIKTTTFIVGVIIFVIDFLISLISALSLIKSHITYKKIKRRMING